MGLKVTTAKRAAAPKLTVDITEYTDPPITLVFKEPDVAMQFEIGDAIMDLRINGFADLPAKLLQTIATLGLCHVAPDGDGKPMARWYAELSQDNGPLFNLIQARFVEAYPSLGDLGALVEKAKNG